MRPKPRSAVTPQTPARCGICRGCRRMWTPMENAPKSPCRAPSPRLPQPTTTSWKTSDVFLSPLETSTHPSDGWPDVPTATTPSTTTMVYDLYTKGGRVPDSHGPPDLKVATSINCEPLSSLRSDSGHLRRNRWSPSSEYAVLQRIAVMVSVSPGMSAESCQRGNPRDDTIQPQ